MSDRIIDTVRAGGAGNAAPKRGPVSYTITHAEAIDYAERNRWRKIIPLGLAAVYALEAEIALRDEVAKDALQDCNILRAQMRRQYNALHGAVGCPHDDGLNCTRDPYDWGLCCVVRLRMVKAGLL